MKSLESVDITGSQATYGGLGVLLIDLLGTKIGPWFVTHARSLNPRVQLYPSEIQDPRQQRQLPIDSAARSFIELVGPHYCDDAIPFLIRGFPNVNTLKLRSTAISSKGLGELGALKELESLAIEDMNDLEGIAGIPSLLNLTFNKLGAHPIPPLENLPNLRSITCEGYEEECRYTGEAIEQILQIAKSSPDFTQLVLTDAIIDENHIRQIASVHQVAELDLTGTHLTNESLRLISGMQNLESLKITGAEVTDEGVAHLAKLTKLRLLRIFDCPKVTDESVPTMKNLKLLERLGVFDTGMTKSALLDIEQSSVKCSLMR